MGWILAQVSNKNDSKQKDDRLFSDEHYVNSDEWKRVKKQRLEYDGYKCRNCGSTKNLQVHHKDYNCFQGMEDIKMNLITLCNDCHYKITMLNRRKRKVICD